MRATRGQKRRRLVLMLGRGRAIRLRRGSAIHAGAPVLVRAPFTDGAPLILRPSVEVEGANRETLHLTATSLRSGLSGFPSRIK